ncbi:MAG: AAA family ATPase, partial [Candidatus Heimdallarchaeota archaeon]
KENEKLVMIGESIKNIYSRVPELIIQSISENISNFITQKMNDLLSGHGFERAILTYEGDIEVYSKNQKIDKRTLSGGEFTILGLILRIALADFVAKLDFLILDEPTNHLDDRRVNEFIEMVDKDNIFESSKGQLIIVTHREEFGRNAKNTIHVNVRGNQREVIA